MCNCSELPMHTMQKSPNSHPGGHEVARFLLEKAGLWCWAAVKCAATESRSIRCNFAAIRPCNFVCFPSETAESRRIATKFFSWMERFEKFGAITSSASEARLRQKRRCDISLNAPSFEKAQRPPCVDDDGAIQWSSFSSFFRTIV